MNKHELRSMLQSDVTPKHLQETQQMCTVLLEEQIKFRLVPEERTTFWQFLSDVMRHMGWRLWGTQGIVLLLVCACVFSIPNTPKIIPIFMPLFILACLPSFFQSTTFGMSEIEAATRASGAQIILAKLVLAGAAEIVIATIICGFSFITAKYPVTIIQIILYVIVPFLGCLILLLWSIRTRERYAMQFAVAECLGTSVFAGGLAHWLPDLYDLSALGIWMITFVVFAGFFIRELFLLIKTWKEGKMYGIIA